MKNYKVLWIMLVVALVLIGTVEMSRHMEVVNKYNIALKLLADKEKIIVNLEDQAEKSVAIDKLEESIIDLQLATDEFELEIIAALNGMNEQSDVNIALYLDKLDKFRQDFEGQIV